MTDEQPPRPTDDDRGAWKTYWQAQGMPWRTEPEIDEDRQAYLTERRTIRPDIQRGIYPFKDIQPKLTRADVEWLLATHESCGVAGPVDWNDEEQREREGLDLRGADLREVDLQALPLARIRGGLLWPEERVTSSSWEDNAARLHLEGASLKAAQLQGARLQQAHLENVSFNDAHMEAADLRSALLEGADFHSAHLEGACLVWARLQGTNFRSAHLEGKAVFASEINKKARLMLQPADLRGAILNSLTDLSDTTFGTPAYGVVCAADVQWGGANLGVVNWTRQEPGKRQIAFKTVVLGDERLARQAKDQGGMLKSADKRLAEFDEAVRANRQLATVLRYQGLNEDADHFAYRAQVLQREVLRRQHHYGRWLFSGFLDALAGHGYKPERSLIAYLLAILGFGIAYYCLGQAVGPHLSPLGAFVFSMTSFHGRGFFPGGIALDDPITVLAALEAFVGLIIEVSFIATFTQRFFAR